MMRNSLLAIAALMFSGSPAAGVEHGGKVAWVRDASFGLAKARLEGRATMLFFTASFCGYCKQLGASAFSDDAVVSASQRLVPIYVDCTKKGDNAELLSKYKVQGYPTVIYADADGNPLREMQSRDASAIIKDIDVVVARIVPRPTVWQPSVAAATEIGKKNRKPVALYFADPKSDPAKVNAKLMKDLGDRKTKFVWVLEQGLATTLKKYELETAPAVVVLDPKTEETLARITVKDDDKADVLNKALDEAAKLLKK